MSETEAWAQQAINDLKKNDQEQSDDEALKKLLKDAVKEAMQEVTDEHDNEWTREKIMAVKSTSQRQKLIKEHPELFK